MHRDLGVEAEHEPAEGSYFVSAYPPFSCWSPRDVDRFRAILSHPPSNEPLGLYVHVPFCEERCKYCYYLSRASPGEALVDEYLDGLLGELEHYARSPFLAHRELDFVYFGGGTPSTLSPPQIRRMLAGIRRRVPWRAGAEVTFECAPRTALPDRLRALRDEGVTRLSMGVQQLDDDVLRRNGRIHTVGDVERAYVDVRGAGFDVVNLDLMAGLVGETESSFVRSLERVLEMAPDSVTIYALEIPRNTPLFRSIERGEVGPDLPSWPLKRQRVAAAFAALERAGYTVRSAYSAVRDPRRHRFVYQDAQYRGADLVGAGASAFSFLDGVHQQNLTSLKDYLTQVERGELPLWRAYALNDTERSLRELVLQLKLGRCETSALAHKYGVDLRPLLAGPLERFERRGWLRMDESSVNVTREGLPRVDRMIPELYLEPHRERPHS